MIGQEARAQIARADRAAAGRGGRLRRRRQQRDRHVPPVRRRRSGAADRRRGRRATASRPASTRRTLTGGQRRRAARRALLRAAGRRRPGDRDAQHLGGAGLSGRRAGARLPEGQRAGRVRRRHRRRGAGGVPAALPHRRASSPRWSRRTPSTTRMQLAPTLRPRRRSMIVNLSGRGDKDMTPWPTVLGAEPRRQRRPIMGVARIRAAFPAPARGSVALIPYVPAGYPTPATDARDHPGAGRGGRRPDRDGHAVQRSAGRRGDDPARHQVALEGGMTFDRCLDLVRDAAAPGARAAALHGLLQPAPSPGRGPRVRECAAAGVDGLIVPDLPPEEAELSPPPVPTSWRWSSWSRPSAARRGWRRWARRAAASSTASPWPVTGRGDPAARPARYLARVRRHTTLPCRLRPEHAGTHRRRGRAG